MFPSMEIGGWVDLLHCLSVTVGARILCVRAIFHCTGGYSIDNGAEG